MPTDESVFDNEKMRQFAESVGLSLHQRAASKLAKELEAVGWDYYFTLAVGPPPEKVERNPGIQTISDPEVAAFTVRDRLQRIERAANRAYATSWSKSERQAASLLELLARIIHDAA